MSQPIDSNVATQCLDCVAIRRENVPPMFHRIVRQDG